MTTTSTTLALATSALQHEGTDAYFPGLDPKSFGGASVLAAYLDAHPDLWSAPDDASWSFAGSVEDLVALAVAEGAEVLPGATSTSIHVSTFGASAPKGRYVDLDGFLPTEHCGPWDLRYDHGTEDTHDADGELTAYGEWWEDQWLDIVDEAVAATEAAAAAVAEWRDA